MTLCLLFLQLGLGITCLVSSDHSYVLWTIGGAGSAILMILGAIAGPFGLALGVITKRSTIARCGAVLFTFNTLPLAGLVLFGHLILGNQYQVRGADGLPTNRTAEQSDAPNTHSPSAQGVGGR